MGDSASPHAKQRRNMALIPSKELLIEEVEQSGILIVREMHSFFNLNEDFVFPHIILTLCLSGSARAKYDMRVITHRKNDLAFIMPGHVMHPMDCTDDFTYALFFISPKMFDDLRFHTFTPLTKEQIADVVRLQMKRVTDMLEPQGIRLECTPQAIAFLAEEGYDPDFGARPVKRAIQQLVLNDLSRKILSDQVDREKPIIIDEFGDGLVFRN